MAVSYKWINEHGEGHYEVTCGDVALSCDPGELNETIEEVKAIASR